MSLFVAMVVIVVAMLVTLALAGLVVAYVAFIQQGREIPRAPWLTEAITRAGERWGAPAPDGDPAASRAHDTEPLLTARGSERRAHLGPRADR